MKKRSRKLRKVLLVTCCALALVAISVGATLAYLTDSEGVTNVFTVGHVDIKLDEAKVDANGKEITGAGAERVQSNSYHLLPGMVYDKDPTITIEKGSEAAYVVAKIEVTGMSAANNPLLYTEGDKYGFIGFDDIVKGGIFDNLLHDAVEVEDNTATWVAHNDYGTLKLTQTINTVGQSYTFYVYFEDAFAKKTDADTPIVLFEELHIPGVWTNEQIAAIGGMNINVSAYAIQAAGFDNVYEAFAAGNDTGWAEDYDFDNDEGTNP